MLGRSASCIPKQQEVAAPPTPVLSGLEPYTGPWGYAQAAHLLRRTTFAPTKAQIQAAVSKGLLGTLNLLLTKRALPSPPINYSYAYDPRVPIGQTWVNDTFNKTAAITTYRHLSLHGWTIMQMLTEGTNLREKMTLFWVNHFGIAGIGDPRFRYFYTKLLRENAWGNFRDLIKRITIDPSMLRFLNGNQNTLKAPNENYARELLELFTIGKGPQVGPGDYTNYTEQDVQAIARVLTGWKDVGFQSEKTTEPVGSKFFSTLHDANSKKLSARFDNAVIGNLGQNEYAHLIDIIFKKEEVARFICRKLYRWFVYYEISEQVETNIIRPLAQRLIANNYNLELPLRTLLGSAHFFDAQNVGSMIKSPFDYVMSIMRPLRVPLPPLTKTKYTLGVNLKLATDPMEQQYFDLPAVAGWKAYYQEPQYYRAWINASTLQYREKFLAWMLDRGYRYDNFPINFDFVKCLELISDPKDPNKLIHGFAQLLLPQPLNGSQVAALKEVLIPGLPDFEWTVEYSKYLANPADKILRKAINNKLRAMVSVIMRSAEFQLM